MLPKDIRAITDFDTHRHIYLRVAKTSCGRNYLEAKHINWFGRIFMYLGWSNASMSKVINYLVHNPEHIQKLPTPLSQKLHTRIVKYEKNHSCNNEHIKILNTYLNPPSVDPIKETSPVENTAPNPRPIPGPAVAASQTSSNQNLQPTTSSAREIQARQTAPLPSTVRAKTILGEYPLQDVSPLDHSILFNGRAWVYVGLLDISEWKVDDKIILKQDDYQDKGRYLVRNTRLSEEVYFSPCSVLKPTIKGSQTCLAKTLWKDRIRNLEGNRIYFDKNTPIPIYSNFPQHWKVRDVVGLIQDGDQRYIRNITQNDRSILLT